MTTPDFPYAPTVGQKLRRPLASSHRMDGRGVNDQLLRQRQPDADVSRRTILDQIRTLLRDQDNASDECLLLDRQHRALDQPVHDRAVPRLRPDLFLELGFTHIPVFELARSLGTRRSASSRSTLRRLSTIPSGWCSCATTRPTKMLARRLSQKTFMQSVVAVG